MTANAVGATEKTGTPTEFAAEIVESLKNASERFQAVNQELQCLAETSVRKFRRLVPLRQATDTGLPEVALNRSVAASPAEARSGS